MKLKFKSQIFSSVLFLLLSLSFNAQAEDCLSLIKSLLPKIDQEVAAQIDIENHLNHRKFIAQFAKKHGIPVFIKQNDHGVDVPVILVNKQSAPKLKALFENSFGTQVALQKDWNNDHGLLRNGKYLIDLDSPGARGFGEIEQTGLAWKNLETYLPKRSAGSSPVLEVSYLLTPHEKSVIDYYQKVRRSALFRVKFSFGGFQGPNYPNMLSNGGEHCFIFCKAEAVSAHVHEIKSRLADLGLENPDQLLNDPQVLKNLTIIQDILNEVEPDKLHHGVLGTDGMLDLLKDHFPQTIVTKAQKLEFLNWVVSYDASKKYSAALKTLGVTRDYGIRDAINQRASAVFIYDEGADINSFNNATYSNYGKFVSWPTTKQYPVD